MRKESISNMQLRQTRLGRHLSLAEAAELAKVSVEAYSRWEYGTQIPRLSSLRLLCEGFNCTPEEVGFANLIQAAGERPVSSLIMLTEEQTALVASLLQQGDNIIVFDASKRKTLEQIFAAAGIVLATPLVAVDPEPWERKSTDVDEGTLNHLEGLTQTCWELSNGSELQIVESILPQFLPRLVEIAPYQPRAAALVAQGLQLKSILSAHQLQIADKIACCKEAISYAKQAKNTNVLVACLLELGVAYLYDGKPMDALQSYQEALFSCKDASPVLQARTYEEIGAALVKCGRGREALFYLGMAHDTLPDYPENDPFFVISGCCGHDILSLYDGIIHLELGDPAAAIKGFETYKSSPSNASVPERCRLEIVNHHGHAAILSKDLDLYGLCLEDGLSGATALGSRKRFDEAVTIFQQDMPKAWLHESRIKGLAEQYHLMA